ncbi:pheST operon leader peptide PheM [Serratia ficaria]|uniref:pheST attenuator peptide n=1 Tax=Dickeya lacustris TaxID=2259638 RepID=A0ABY8GCC3_9GAMM|nr:MULTISPECIES: pheST operon leader peptide PheM [Enterobacterales]MEE4409623.1 pheST operon leader peptide PheM [Serratia sp. C2(2)]MEE4446853.1 pheST operon leader peptide PheM [Serratia sp. C2(1)]MCT6590382.1 pheST operon leader peptide PheM [Pantoea dispersa]MEE4484513.1 pheST operon leader peptide PheM [Serratia ficaria]NIG12804.1 pheST operon leader peptide PheM [Pantoea sp. Cy-640]
MYAAIFRFFFYFSA